MVQLPTYRGMSLVSALAWLISTRLAVPGAAVEWRVERKQGHKSIARLLDELGWVAMIGSRDGDTVRLDTIAPSSAACPEPATFETAQDGRQLSFAADYGVFSPRRIDDGTALLIEFARREPVSDVIADIGIGYGAIAISLVAAGAAGRAVGSDVDTIALALAARNATTNAVALELMATPDPTALPPTPVTVCNVPTHIDSEATARLCAALASRARTGVLLAVVHASLERRYAGLFADTGRRVSRHPGASHIVLRVSAPGSC